jgi:hypothetical protein
MIHDIGIQARAGHQQKVARSLIRISGEGTDRDALGHPFVERRGRPLHRFSQPQFRCQYVGSAGRKNTERYVGVDYAVDSFVDGSIAPRH